MKNNNLKYLQFGEPTEKQKALMMSETPLIEISPDSISVSPPPPNLSKRTMSDLRVLVRILAEPGQNDVNFMNIADEKPLLVFQSFTRQNNLQFDKKYFKNLKKQLASFILRLKFKFNRPRPYQVAKELGLEFPSLDYESANTPSYPSGHTIQAHAIANVLSSLYPKYTKEFEKIADRISLSRVQAGVHFPGDIESGKEVASLIEPYIVKPSYLKERKQVRINERQLTLDFLHKSFTLLEGTKLRILDFDDTLAMTTERVRVETPAGPKMISSKEFAVYDLLPGERIDPALAFDEFSKVDVKTAKPVPFISDLFKKFVTSPGDRKVLILTARGQEVEEYVMNFLREKLGIESPEASVEFRGVNNKDPAAKVSVIEEYIEQNPDIDFISFYDDSGKNVKAVKSFISGINTDREKDEMIRYDVRQVVEDEEGNIRLIRNDKTGEIEESFDMRTITRQFLTSR